MSRSMLWLLWSLLPSLCLADVNVNYSLVPDNFLWDALPGSIPVIQSFNLIVPNVAREVEGGALVMLDVTTKCWSTGFGPFTGVEGKRSSGEIASPDFCGAKNKTVMQSVAFYVLVISQYPDQFVPLSFFMASIGVPVDFSLVSQTLPSSGFSDYQLGLISGRAAVAFFNQDGANSQGDEVTASATASTPYSDYTNYVASLANTPYKFDNCNQWQPLTQKDAQTTGFKVQAPVTPHWRFVFNLYNDSMETFVENFPHIYASCNHGPHGRDKLDAYYAQANAVAARLAALAVNDTKKMIAEHGDDKLALFFSVWATVRFSLPGPFSNSTPWTSDDDVVFLAVGDSAGLAGGVAAWAVKFYTQSVRPLNVFHNLLPNDVFLSWGGQYMGVKNITGRDMITYLNQQGHPSYPSGTCCFVQALIAAFQQVLHTDALPSPIVLIFLAGSSKIEPAIPGLFGYPGKTGTPATDITVVFNTLSSYAAAMCDSRLDSGVHFAADVAASTAQCPVVGNKTAVNTLTFVSGEATEVLNPLARDQFSSHKDPLRKIDWFK